MDGEVLDVDKGALRADEDPEKGEVTPERARKRERLERPEQLDRLDRLDRLEWLERLSIGAEEVP
jgi:hypothetical protein